MGFYSGKSKDYNLLGLADLIVWHVVDLGLAVLEVIRT